ncbi:MAG: helix-turn-helix transcriptional regulator [Candidatus Nitrotoga sp.]|jgi:transcriptional regulator with XRE-family HTH domain
MPKQLPAKSVFSRRLREARLQSGIAQDRLGVMIGLDEGCSSARMSRYENGVHEPPFPIIESIAGFLNVPVAYFFCDDDKLAEIMRIYSSAKEKERQAMLDSVVALGGKPAK